MDDDLNQQMMPKKSAVIIALLACALGVLVGVVATYTLVNPNQKATENIMIPDTILENAVSPSPLTISITPTPSAIVPTSTIDDNSPFRDCTTDADCPAGWVCKEGGSCATYQRPAPITPSM